VPDARVDAPNPGANGSENHLETHGDAFTHGDHEGLYTHGRTQGAPYPSATGQRKQSWRS